MVSTKSRLDHRSYFFNRVTPDQHCWTQFGKTPVFNPCHTGATAWALWAMATNSIRPTSEMGSYLLDLQDSRGWWPLYPGAGNSQEVASTFATAISLLALQSGLTANMIADAQVEQARTAVMRAKAWLMANRVGEQDCQWLAYPNHIGKTSPSPALSGMAVYALLTADPEISGKILLLNNSVMIPDSVRHQKVVWTLLALTRLYPRLPLVSQSRLRGYVESTIFPNATPPESSLKETWQLAEFALMVRSLK